MEDYRFLDEPMDVQLAHRRAKELQKRVENELGIETDQRATCPTEPTRWCSRQMVFLTLWPRL